MTQAELTAKVAQESGCPQTMVKDILKAFSAVVSDAVKKDDSVTFSGVGTFSMGNRAARIGRNPKTGAELKIPATKTLKFKVSKTMKDHLN